MKKMNNKGFSLIELIIVIAIMAILVAIIAPNLTKYLGKSKKKTDAKNADEIAQQLQTAITDYETENNELCADNKNVKLKWSATGAANDSGSTAPNDFLKIVNDNITNSTKSKETGDFATATISKTSGKYTITVKVGNETTTR